MPATLLAGRVAPGRALLAANAASLVLAYAIPRSFTLLAAVAAARVLGAAEFGRYATAGAVAVVASILATAGMQPLLVREVAREPHGAPRLVAAAHLAKAGTVALMAVVLAAAGPLLGFPAPVLAAAALLAAGYGVGAFAENLAAYFQGVERMHVWTQASALAGIVTGAAGVAAVVATRQLPWLCAAAPLGQAAALLWLLRCAPPAVRRPPLPSAAAVAGLLRKLAPFAVAFLATTLYYRADVLLLARWRSPEEVGLYGAALRFMDVVQALALAGAGALLPRLSRGGAARRGDVLRLAVGFAAAAAPVALVLFALRVPILQGLYGPGYAASAPVLALLAPAVVPLAVNMFALAALAAADAMRGAALLYLAATGLAVGLNLAAIPRWGAPGAAVVSLAAESALAIGLVLLLRARSAP